jgi:tetratricopeptide (TPR) repeat protein
MRSRVLFAICVAIAVAAAPALAQSTEALTKAQKAFDQAQADYLQGKFDEAAQGFQDAYAARPFPQFLYNVGASFHMKGKKTSEIEAYQKAVEFYRRYLKEEPTASDKAKVERAIGVLEAEIKRLQDATTTATPGEPTAGPSQEVEQLGDVKVRGLVVITSEPQNANIYLDDKKHGVFGVTPWSGTIEGEHKIIIEKRGYMPVTSTIAADPSKLVQVITTLSQESYLGWVEIASNIPRSDVYIDDKSVGAVGQTPWSQQIKPGKHTFWISAEGYSEYEETIDIAPGGTHAIKAQLKGSPVGKLIVNGPGIEDAQILVDGKLVCERGPCVAKVPEGARVVTVRRDGFKPYSKRLQILARTETIVKVTLAPKPGRFDAVVAGVFAIGFGAGGYFLGTQSQDLKAELEREIAAGMPPPDNNDPRFQRGKIYAIAADASFALAGITALTAIYYAFRDKGPASRATIDARTMALHPQLGPQYAGLGMEVRW